VYLQIFNYVYADEDDYVIAMLGTGMIYNHREPHTVEHFEATRGRSRSHPQTKLLPQSQHYKLDFKTLRPIAAGEELFGNYGEEWFWTRGIEVDDSLDSAIPMLYESLETLREVGHCLSDIQINRYCECFILRILFLFMLNQRLYLHFDLMFLKGPPLQAQVMVSLLNVLLLKEKLFL
jgi:hypothetical protein